MNQNSILFEVITAGFLASSGSWFYLEAYAGPGLLIVSGILFCLTLTLRANEIAAYVIPVRYRTDIKIRLFRIQNKIALK